MSVVTSLSLYLQNRSPQDQDRQNQCLDAETPTVENKHSPTSTLEHEDELVMRAQGGDHLAFTALLKFYDRRVMNLTLRFTGNQYDRDDLYQNIFTACFVALPTFSRQSKFYTWLYRIAMNQCIDYMHKNRPREAAEDIISAEPNWDRERQLKAINNALANLDGSQRISFHLFYVEQWTNNDIAQLLECSTGTVKSHLDRARKKVRLDNEVSRWLIND